MTTGLLGLTVNISLITLFTDLLSLNGINFNLEQLLFGFHTIENSNLKVDRFEVKRYHAMESSDGGNSGQSSDKGKGIDPSQQPFYDSNSEQSLDKGKGVDRSQHPSQQG